MNEREDVELRRVVAEVAEAVEPGDRLAEIRARTTAATPRRAGGWSGGATVLLAAAAVVVVALIAGAVAGLGSGRGDDLVAGPVPSYPTSGAGAAATTAVYYVGPGGDGPDARPSVLYRYFEPAADPLTLLMSRPTDPDYTTRWPPGSLLSWEVVDEEVVVQVSRSGTDGLDGPDVLRHQQLIYTMQAAVGARIPVVVANPDVELEQFTRAAPVGTLSQMSISDPGEGFTYSGSMRARGVANGFEGSVACRLIGDGAGARDFGPFVTTSGGLLANRPLPWRIRVDLGDVPPGAYTFSCSTDDPSAGTDGAGAFTDTRTIIVE